jgi:hypothetical protein
MGLLKPFEVLLLDEVTVDVVRPPTFCFSFLAFVCLILSYHCNRMCLRAGTYCDSCVLKLRYSASYTPLSIHEASCPLCLPCTLSILRRLVRRKSCAVSSQTRWQGPNKATVLYATHVFDSLNDWPTHIIHIGNHKVRAFCPLDTCEEYNKVSCSDCMSFLLRLSFVLFSFFVMCFIILTFALLVM